MLWRHETGFRRLIGAVSDDILDVDEGRTNLLPGSDVTTRKPCATRILATPRPIAPMETTPIVKLDIMVVFVEVFQAECLSKECLEVRRGPYQRS